MAAFSPVKPEAASLTRGAISDDLASLITWKLYNKSTSLHKLFVELDYDHLGELSTTELQLAIRTKVGITLSNAEVSVVV
jgi:hypothetical protein